MKVIALEKEMELPIPTLEAMYSQEDIEPSILVSDIMAPVTEVLGQQ